ncbi:cell division protein FtsK [Streptomyces sp. NPDC008079]|uniref:cell division protein FtsK n=1 Tax=Streptomyces sp. NPDC008079 TaxID=3364806 RepID=UPI0036E7A499
MTDTIASAVEAPPVPDQLVTEPAAPPADEPDEQTAPVPADNPKLPGTGVFREKRKPILPGWLSSTKDFRANTVLVSSRAWYATRYHGLRTPWYTVRLTTMAPRGAARLLAEGRRWVWDAEAAPLRSAAVRDEDHDEYMRLAKLRGDRVRLRGLLAVVALTCGIGLAITLYVLGDTWLYLAGAVAVLALGYAGQAVDSPVIGPAVMRTEVQKLTGPLVLRALDAIGNAKISAAIKRGGDMNGLRFTSEITRDGPGYRADLDLPWGVVADDIMEERKALASGLRRKLGCVWPGPGDEHEGSLVLWVGDKPMNETTKPAWPLLKEGQVDLFRPIVFGNDQRMRDMTVTLMFASVVIGSIPRMGKTFLLRLLLLIAALDPRAEVWGFDLKGTGDLGALEPVAHRYRAGEDAEDIEYIVQSLRELKAELRRRAKVIKSLPRSVCPESKVTPALAGDKALGLHPIVLGVDECQVLFEDPEHGAEIESICVDVTKRGPALGIAGIFATQRPDAKSLPPGISANAVLRFCLKVMNHQANDMVLGTGAYKSGIKATMFSRSDRGICWMSGEGDDPVIASSAFVDAVGAESVVERARVMREEYGNITGHAAGLGPSAAPGMDLLGDILKVVAADEEKVWNERVATRLAQLRPDVYAGWEAANVTTALKPWGVTAADVWGTTDDGKGTTRRGIQRADVVAAISRRDADRKAA